MSDNMFSSQDFDTLLDDFISRQLNETEDLLADIQETSETKPSLSPNDETDDSFEENFTEIETDDENSNDDDDLIDITANVDNDFDKLAEEEKRLYNAYSEFIKSSSNCAKEHQIEIPEFQFSLDELLPRFSLNRTENLKSDIAACWDILLQTEYDNLSKLPANASDEQILDFAEKTSAHNLQMSLISYIETLIEIDACETAYNIRKSRYQKHQIEKEIYEEHQRMLNRKRLYAQAIREQNFPVDADLLVNNFFKTANKDPTGAQEILEKNPAIFAPIQIDKIPDKFFGLIKAKPEDGKAVNRKLGKFLTNLKV